MKNLKELEAVVQAGFRGKRDTLAAGVALIDIRDRRLFTQATWTDYLLERWGARAHAYRLIAYATAVSNGDNAISEGQFRNRSLKKKKESLQSETVLAEKNSAAEDCQVEGVDYLPDQVQWKMDAIVQEFNTLNNKHRRDKLLIIKWCRMALDVLEKELEASLLEQD